MKHILLLLLLTTSCSLIAQTCVESIAATTPSDNFVDNENGTITDSKHGLMWMRCSLGQTWQNGSCVGDALALSWQQALVTAHGYVYANQQGWRVPNVKELASITEVQCVRPAINIELFPDTPADDFWSSTPSVTDPQRAWVIAFFNSSNSLKDKKLFVYSRLVRTAN
ncbi:Lcl C-terminal domain-containing protein [Paraglaciecola hydrolytica]|uniref:Adhesin n=1 Tax=Paraglaciecola hydrolytica TaxID=1799789 RepID=A0A148KL36_9ALTE|nr:DUF1566 domain-containing protein [Paraglaciecola hydrolytica]KXI26975.1 adhesin [Paraglaciecola hydrolytica]